MNKNYPTFFLTWFNKFSRVPYPGLKSEMSTFNNSIQENVGVTL